MSDPSLLVLVADDPLAPKVVAAWKALAPQLADSETQVSKIMTVVRANSLEETRRTIERCQLAGLLMDGGISQTAQRWLNSLTVKQVNTVARKKSAAG